MENLDGLGHPNTTPPPPPDVSRKKDRESSSTVNPQTGTPTTILSPNFLSILESVPPRPSTLTPDHVPSWGSRWRRDWGDTGHTSRQISGSVGLKTSGMGYSSVVVSSILRRWRVKVTLTTFLKIFGKMETLLNRHSLSKATTTDSKEPLVTHLKS